MTVQEDSLFCCNKMEERPGLDVLLEKELMLLILMLQLSTIFKEKIEISSTKPKINKKHRLETLA